MVDMSIGDRLRELRTAAGLTQQAMADIAGTSKQYVSQLEKGTNQVPNGLLMEAWSRHFRVNQQWLATGNGPKNWDVVPAGGQLRVSEQAPPAYSVGDFAGALREKAVAARVQALTKAHRGDSSLMAVAEETGLPASDLMAIWEGRFDVDELPALTVFKLARALDTSAHELLFGTPEQRAGEDGKSQAVQLDHWRMAFQLVADFLDSEELMLPPSKHAEVTLLVHDLLLEGLPRAKVLQFVRAAAA